MILNFRTPQENRKELEFGGFSAPRLGGQERVLSEGQDCELLDSEGALGSRVRGDENGWAGANCSHVLLERKGLWTTPGA